MRTSRPMVDACLAAGVGYLDITGEIAVFESVLARGAEAERAGVVLLPGIGFDVVPTDCLALALKERLPDATHLDLAFVAEGGGWSRGTLATMIESLPHAGAMRRNGRIVPLPLAAEAMEIDLPIGRRTVMSIAWGDVSTAFYTTGIANIRTFTGVPASTVRRLRRMRPLLPLAGWKPVEAPAAVLGAADGHRPERGAARAGANLALGKGAHGSRRKGHDPFLDRRRLRSHRANRSRRPAACREWRGAARSLDAGRCLRRRVPRRARAGARRPVRRRVRLRDVTFFRRLRISCRRRETDSLLQFLLGKGAEFLGALFFCRPVLRPARPSAT